MNVIQKSRKNKKRNMRFLVKLVIALPSILVAILFIMIFHTNDSNSNEKPEQIKTSTVEKCHRTQPYEVPPEFSRAISIIKQRAGGYFFEEFENCLNIQYSNLKQKNRNIEGTFLFDPRISSKNNLQVFVDNSYKNYDDYLTSVLLVHEITHANQFYWDSSITCVDMEVEAYYNEFVYLGKLNKEEGNSIIARMYNRNSSAAPPVKSLEYLSDIFLAASGECNKNTECILEAGKKKLKEMVVNSPIYQDQCNL
jgi:hypothetical protein